MICNTRAAMTDPDSFAVGSNGTATFPRVTPGELMLSNSSASVRFPSLMTKVWPSTICEDPANRITGERFAMNPTEFGIVAVMVPSKVISRVF